MTAKQTLVAHITADHNGHIGTYRATLVELQRLHARAHYRLSPDHYHEGINRGPGERPPGWKTGEGAVPRTFQSDRLGAVTIPDNDR